MKASTIFLFIFVFFSCQQKKIHNTTTWNYQNFRKNQRSFNSSDGEIKYVDKGKGEVILLLHGVPSSSWLYRKMIDKLVEEGYRVIAPDMLGFGNSESPEGYEIYSPENHAKRILELMDALKIDEWNHVMHDAGGLWTWELFKLTPKKIKNLVILNTIIYKEGFNPPIKMKEGGFAKFSMWLYENKFTDDILIDQLLKKGLKKNTLTENEEEGYRLPMQEGKTRGMYYFFSNTCSSFPDYNAIISNVSVPVAVIWGKYDDMLEWKPQKEKAIKNLKIQSKNIHIVNGKHFIQEEVPNEIDDIILKFLNE